MVDCNVLAIYLTVGIVLAAGTKWLITRVIEPKVINVRERVGKLNLREVVVGMISNAIGGIGARLTVAALAEAGVIGSSSPLKGSRPKHR